MRGFARSGQPQKKKSLIAILCVSLIPGIVILSIWYPYIRHFYIGAEKPSTSIAVASRDNPAASVLDEIVRQDAMMVHVEELERTPDSTADQILNGRLTLSGVPSLIFHQPFDPEDLKRIPPEWELAFYGFEIPKLFLMAYRDTGSLKYLAAARDYILAWRHYEERAWVPVGFLWNDHAIAQRAHVLIEFWQAYRESPIFASTDAAEVIALAIRAGRMLSDPGLYTFRTNHGVMQNLALLQLRLAFPHVPEFANFGDLAFTRLMTQIPHYINEEGVVLEHSAGYHEFGVELIGAILRDLALLKKPIPTKWIEEYKAALHVYAELRRPDGTLPSWGDTQSSPEAIGPAITLMNAAGEPTAVRTVDNWKPGSPNLMLPAAGISIWWHGLSHWPAPDPLTQTFITWSYYEPLGHKHADELSILLWAGGQRWWTAAGYLSYGPPGSEALISWPGSNAPHILGEPFNSDRRSRLIGHAWSSEISAIDLERRTADGFAVRRQVIQVEPDRWVILDVFHDEKNRQVQTVWLSDQDITKGVNGSFVLGEPRHRDTMSTYFLGSPQPTTTLFRAHNHPYLGWVAAKRGVHPASAIVVEQPSMDTYAINISTLRQGTSEATELPKMISWQGAENWELGLASPNGGVTIARKSSRIIVTSGDNQASISLMPGPNVEPAVQEVLRAYNKDLDIYGHPMRPLWTYRLRMSGVLLALWATQAVIFALIARRYSRVLRPVVGLSALGWTGIAAWLWLVYF